MMRWRGSLGRPVWVRLVCFKSTRISGMAEVMSEGPGLVQRDVLAAHSANPKPFPAGREKEVADVPHPPRAAAPAKRLQRLQRLKPPVNPEVVGEEAMFDVSASSSLQEVRAAALACAKRREPLRALQVLAEFWVKNKNHSRNEIQRAREEFQGFRVTRTLLFPMRKLSKIGLVKDRPRFDVALEVVDFCRARSWPLDEQMVFQLMVAGLAELRFREVAEAYDSIFAAAVEENFKLALQENHAPEDILEAARALALAPKDDGRCQLLRLEAAQRSGEWGDALKRLEKTDSAETLHKRIAEKNKVFDEAVRIAVKYAHSKTDAFRCVRAWVLDLSKRHLAKRESLNDKARPGAERLGRRTIELPAVVDNVAHFLGCVNSDIACFGLLLRKNPNHDRIVDVKPYASSSRKHTGQEHDDDIVAPAPTLRGSDDDKDKDAAAKDAAAKSIADDLLKDLFAAGAAALPTSASERSRRPGEEDSLVEKETSSPLSSSLKEGETKNSTTAVNEAYSVKWVDKCQYQFRQAIALPGPGSVRLAVKALKKYHKPFPKKLGDFEVGHIVKYMRLQGGLGVASAEEEFENNKNFERAAASNDEQFRVEKTEALFQLLLDCQGRSHLPPRARLEVLKARCRLARSAFFDGHDDETYGVHLDRALEFFEEYFMDDAKNDMPADLRDQFPEDYVDRVTARAFTIAIRTTTLDARRCTKALRFHERARERNVLLPAEASYEMVSALAKHGEVEAAIALGVELAEEAHDDSPTDAGRNERRQCLRQDLLHRIYYECRDAACLAADDAATDGPHPKGHHRTSATSALLQNIPRHDYNSLLEVLVAALEKDDGYTETPPYCRADTDLVFESLEINERWRDALDLLSLIARPPTYF